MTNKHNNISKYIFQSVAALFIISLFVTASLLTYAQEEAPATEKANDLPYELGVVLVQYEDTVFQAQVNDGGEAGVVQVPGGLLDNLDGDLGPVAIVNDLLTEEGFAPKLIERFPDLNAEVIHLGEDVDPLSVMDSLIALPGVVLVQPNFLYEPTQAPNDPKLSDAWHLIHTQVYSTDQSDNETAWKAIDGLTTATYVPTIAVIDTGIDTEHPEFKDVSANRDKPQFNRLLNLLRCRVPVFGGLVELDRTESTLTTCPWGGYDLGSNDNNPIHSRRASPHGTMVAGVAAGNRNNNFDSAGVAHFAHIMPIKLNVFSSTAILKSVAFARLNGADIINASFGGMRSAGCTSVYQSSPSPSYRYLLEAQQIRNFPGLFVASAGNDNTKTGSGDGFFYLPADFNQDMSAQGCWDAVPNMISVGGTERSSDISGNNVADSVEGDIIKAQGIVESRWRSRFVRSGSNYNANVDIAAPSTDILVSSLDDSSGSRVRITKRTAGTSFSAPLVAGTLALMLRANHQLTSAELKRRLLESADELVSLTGPDCTAGTADDYVHRGRRLNAYNAVRAALGLSYTKKEISDLTAAQQATCLRGGKDSDGDGLIDITTVEELNNIRHNLAGTSYKTDAAAQGITTGCPVGGCNGYELVNSLDFVGTGWETAGWTPIDNFTGTFDGGNHVVYNLPSTRVASTGHQIFGTNGSGAEVRNVSFIKTVYWGCNASVKSQCTLSDTDYAQTPSGSCPVGDAGACSYRCDKGHWQEVTNTCTQPTVSCVTDPSTLMNGTVTRQGSWVKACASTHRSDRYAQYYTFTLSTQREVRLNLLSPTNAFLYLNAHAPADRYKSGVGITRNDNGGKGSNARIVSILPAGTYTVEATTFATKQTDSFTLNVKVVDPPASACSAVSQTWTVGGNSCSGNLTAVPRGVSQAIDDIATPTVGSAVFRCDTNGGWTRVGKAKCVTVTCPAVNRSWTVDGNTCAGNLAETNAGSMRVASDQSGSATGSATYECNAQGTKGRWSLAKNTTCTSTAATCPAGDQTWTVNGNVCSVSLRTAISGSTQYVQDQAGPTTGATTYECDANGRWSRTGTVTCINPSVTCPVVKQTWVAGGNTCFGNTSETVAGNPFSVSNVSEKYRGSATYQCNADGRWTQASGATTCAVAVCPASIQVWTVGGNTCREWVSSTTASNSQTAVDDFGGAVGSATYQCKNTGHWVRSSGATCDAVTTCPGSSDQTWTVNGNTCNGRIILVGNVGKVTRLNDNSGSTTGTIAYLCGADGRWRERPNAVTTCVSR